MRISDWSSDVCSSDLDVVEALLAREHGRQHDAVVIDARLGAENRYAIAVRIAREQFLDRAASGHAVADDDQVFARLGAGFQGAMFHRSIQSSRSEEHTSELQSLMRIT